MGDLIGRTRGRAQVKTVSKRGFCAARRQRFLDALALTCNVTKSADFAGVTPSTVCRARSRDAAFGEQWRTALALGYDRLEARMLEHGGAGMPIEPDPERATAAGCVDEPFDFDRVLAILKYRLAAREGRNPQTGRPPRNATRDDTNAALLKALKAAQRRVAAGDDRDG